MSNMSYCRFQNTLPDLNDCVEALGEGEPLSADEAEAARDMATACEEFLAAFKENGVKEEEDDDEYDDTDPHDFMGR